MESVTEAAASAEDVARTDTMIVRQFTAEFTAGDGRTVDVRIVPYNTPARVSDDGRTVYREEWAPGCFDEQLVAGHRLKVLLNFEHLSGVGNLVGKGIALRSEPDGLHGSFRMLTTEAGDTALELVNDGILDSVSLEAKSKAVVRTAEGVVRRVKAHLHNVALCRNPAFVDAKVLAVREENIPGEVVIDEKFLPKPLSPERVERLRAQGIVLPDRYTKAHPEQTDTPAEADTPDDGTRLSENHTTQEE